MPGQNSVDILLVDDKDHNLLALEASLKSPGYNLVKARSGREALAYLLDHECAVILLDVQMPGMDGFETAAMIKQSRRSRQIPIIFITAISKEERFVHQGYRTGAVDYVFKPLEPDILRAKIEVFADLYRSKKEIARQAELLRESDRKELARQLAQIQLKNLRREQASQVRYQQLVNGIENAIIWSAEPRSLCFLFVSPSAEAILGYPLATWREEPRFWSQHLHPDDRTRFFEALERLKPQQDAEKVEHRSMRSDGRIVWFQTALRLEPRLDGDRFELRGLSVVITQIKEAEEWHLRNARRARFLSEANLLLTESFDYEKALKRTAPLIVPEFADAYAVWLRNENEETCALEPAFSESAPEGLRDYFRPGDRPPAYPEVCERIIAAGPVLHRGRNAAPPPPEEFPGAEAAGIRTMIGAPIVSGGRAVGVVVFASTHTARVYDEADLDMLKDFAHRAGLAIENAHLHREANEAVRVRDEFLSIASHELKTPLTPLLLQAQSLKRKLRRGTRLEPQMELLERAVGSLDRQVRRLAQLVDELLDVSRINVGQLRLQIQPVDLREVVKEVVERICNDSPEPPCPVEFAAECSAVGQWDGFRIEQVVTNLLTNAMKYSDGKPVKVSVSADGDHAKLTVEDHGLGIAKEDQSRIFERFERAVSARNFGGLGLGLYIAKAIVDSHAGSIRVESELGKGSTFIVELPLVSEIQRQGAAAEVLGVSPEFAGAAEEIPFLNS